MFYIKKLEDDINTLLGMNGKFCKNMARIHSLHCLSCERPIASSEDSSPDSAC